MPATTYEPMSVRILADKTGARTEDGSWPVAGLQFGSRDGKSAPPKRSLVSHSSLGAWRARGIVSTEGSRIVVRSGGPPENPWAGDSVHVFEHLDAVVFHVVDGDVRYDVVENPDKWPETKDGEAGFGGEVRWVYDLKLAEGGA